MTILAALVEFAWSAPLLAVLLGAARPSPGGAFALYLAAWAAVRLGSDRGPAAGTVAALAVAVGAGLIRYRTTSSAASTILILIVALVVSLRLAAVHQALAEPGQPPLLRLPALGVAAGLCLYRLLPGYWPTGWGHPAYFAAAAAVLGALLLAERAATSPGAEPPAPAGARRAGLAAALRLGLAAVLAAGLLGSILTPSTAGAALGLAGEALARLVWYLGIALFYAFRWVARLPLAFRPRPPEDGSMVGTPVTDPVEAGPTQLPPTLAAGLGLLLLVVVVLVMLRLLRGMLRTGTVAAPPGAPAEDATPLDDEPRSWVQAARRWWHGLTGGAERDPDPQVERVRAAFRQVLSAWARAGRPRDPQQTPAEFARRAALPPTDPQTAAALDELRMLYEAARYGRRAGPGDAARAEDLRRRALPHG